MKREECKEEGGKWDSAKEVCSFDDQPNHQVKNPGIAAVLSFVWPGAGQIYNERIARGFLIMVALSMSVLLMFFFVGFILFPVIWAWQIYDARNIARELNRV